MIGKVTRGSDVAGLLRYLYGPGRANEHKDPHLVVSWLGDSPAVLAALEPRRAPATRRFAPLAERLSLPVSLLPEVPDRHVWQCSMRLADSDRRLNDAEWATVAREVVTATGFASLADPGGCRWAAVRHADDHVHVVVVLARQDGGRVDVFRDWPKVHAAARAVERKFGLTTVPSPDRTANVAPTRAETEKALRATGAEMPPRAWLTRRVRAASAGSTGREQFAELLLRDPEVVLGWRESVRSPGQMTGYRVGRRGDVDARGQQVWFSGSKLSPDLSLPRLVARWAEITSETPPRERLVVLRTAQRGLHRAGKAPSALTAVSAGEVAAVLAQLSEGRVGGPLTEAAEHLARAARQPSGVRPGAGNHLHSLRHVAADLSRLGRLLPDEAGDALVIAAHLSDIATTLSRGPASGPGSRGKAAHEAVQRLRGAAGRTTAADVAVLQAAVDPVLAQQILVDPAWPALAAELRRTAARGLDPSVVLAHFARRRELVSAESAAAVLHHRLSSFTPARGRGAPAPPPSRTAAARPRRG